MFSGVLRAAELRANSGETNQLEMISARSNSLEVRNQLQQVSADLAIYNQKLQALLNIEYEIYPPDQELYRADFTLIDENLALSGNPSAKQVQQQVELSHFEKKLESSRMLPDFKVGYFSLTMQGVQDVNGVPQNFGTGDRFTGIQAGIEIPLWFFPYTAKTKAAKLNEQIALTNAEYYSKSLLSNYRSLIGEYTKYRNSVDYYEKQAMPQANIIIDQATRSYKAGAMDYLEYVHNLSRALEIKLNYLNALNSYNQTIINIEFITGKIF
jgi:cobalt-zinc-cadmium resistance protein CzcA